MTPGATQMVNTLPLPTFFETLDGTVLGEPFPHPSRSRRTSVIPIMEVPNLSKLKSRVALVTVRLFWGNARAIDRRLVQALFFHEADDKREAQEVLEVPCVSHWPNLVVMLPPSFTETSTEPWSSKMSLQNVPVRFYSLLKRM
jgi:hypothetical protein